jgi:hypothetical protein
VTKRNVDPILIPALAVGKTRREAAKMADVSERTVRRRLEDPQFQFELDQYQRRTAQQTEEQLLRALSVGVDALVDVLRHSTDDQARVKAAGTVLNLRPLTFEPPPPPAPDSPTGPSVTQQIRERLAEMNEQPHQGHSAENGQAAENRPEADKTGQY